MFGWQQVELYRLRGHFSGVCRDRPARIDPARGCGRRQSPGSGRSRWGRVARSRPAGSRPGAYPPLCVADASTKRAPGAPAGAAVAGPRLAIAHVLPRRSGPCSLRPCPGPRRRERSACPRSRGRCRSPNPRTGASSEGCQPNTASAARTWRRLRAGRRGARNRLPGPAGCQRGLRPPPCALQVVVIHQDSVENHPGPGQLFQELAGLFLRRLRPAAPAGRRRDAICRRRHRA